MKISLEHDRLKADLASAAQALAVHVTKVDDPQPSLTGRVHRQRTLTIALPKPTPVSASFVREGLVERVKKLFVEEVEVGSAVFDDLVYVVTSTPAATAALLEHERVQQALLLLVDATRHVQTRGSELRVVDTDAPDDGRDALAEALALAAHLI
jgi:hypothetical protein